MNEAHSRRRLGNRLAPPRFVGFLLILPGAFFACRWLGGSSGWKEAAAMSFDVAAACFLISLLPLLRDSTADQMRRHSAENDANRLLVLVIASLVTVAAMTAIAGELGRVRAGEPLASAKLVGTMLLIWLFANTVYAIHYAHVYYGRGETGDGDTGGFDFPGTKTPDYVDFVYFAFTLGMTFQTSDVTITARAVRHVALLHAFVAFLFNIGVIAFTISVLGGSG